MAHTPGVSGKLENENERLAKLYSYHILDDYDKSGDFKHVAAMAVHIFQVPMAFVNFVDEKRVLTQASIGMNGISEVDREISLCSLVILRDEITVFENAALEHCLFDNPVVHGEMGLQFYAGAPVKTPDGFNIGVVGIADKKPRAFSKDEEQMLAGLAAIVMDELEER